MPISNEKIAPETARSVFAGRAGIVASGIAVLAVSAGCAWLLHNGVGRATAQGGQRLAATTPDQRGSTLDATIGRGRRSLASTGDHAPPRLTRIVIEAGLASLVEGQAQSRSRVVLLRGGRPVGETTADGDGRWQMTLERGLGPDDHRLQLKAVAADGGAESIGDPLRVSVPRGLRERLVIDFAAVAPVRDTAAETQPATAVAAPVVAATVRVAELARPVAASEGALGTVREFLQQADERYRQVVVGRLSQFGESSGTAATAAVAAVVAQAQPAPRTSGGDGSVVDGIVDWLRRSSEVYQKSIVKRLSEPSVTLESLEAKAREEEARKASDARIGEDAQRKAREELRAAQAKRDAELAAAEAAKKAIEGAPAAAAKVDDAGARKAAEEKRAAELKAAEDRRLADEAAKRLAEQQKAAEAKKSADEAAVRKAADEKRLADEAAKRLAEQQKAAEAKKSADEAALRKAADEKRLADEAARRATAEAQRAADMAREAEVRRQADLKAAEDARQKQAASAKAAEDAKRRAADLAEAASKEAASRIATSPSKPVREALPPLPSVSTGRPDAVPPPVVASRPELPPLPSVWTGRSQATPPPAATRAARMEPPARSRPPFDTRTRSSLGATVPPRPAQRSRKVADEGDRCRRAGRKIEPPGYYVVQSGDSLWDIADMHYDDGARYDLIERANRKIEDPELIRPCQRLFIPAARRN